jgi:radical SAM-linked protein
MTKKRLLFEKTGRAKFISHLDLLRTFQRIFRRAGLELKHSEGFNPHPQITFALPLSVGAESVCELADIGLVSEISGDALPELLNSVSPEGIRFLKAYTPGRKFAEIRWLETEGTLYYDDAAGAQWLSGAAGALTGLFAAPTLVITKKTKKGEGEFDVIPAIHSIRFEEKSGNEISVRAVVSAQSPTMNPEHLVTAIRTHMPAYAPDFAAFRRLELYDKDHNVFR